MYRLCFLVYQKMSVFLQFSYRAEGWLAGALNSREFDTNIDAPRQGLTLMSLS